MGNLIEEKNPYQIEKEKQHDDTMWGKPANDIITGIGNIADVPPMRAIWEMIQNARDVANDGHSDIVFTRDKDCFTFQHNGISFTNETLEALINQTSSKSRENTVQAGQYGTGFLVTHKFGLKFELSGSVKLLKGKEEYHHFQGLLVDRSTKNKEEMVKSLKKTYEETRKWTERPEVHDRPAINTIFRYIHEHDIERKNVKEAFELGAELLPYVMALNPSVASIEFKDKVEKKNSVKYIRNGEEFILETETYRFIEKSFKKIEEGREAQTESVYLLESIQRDDKSNTPHVTIILPISKSHKGYRASLLGENIPRLFVYLPLIGTEKWGVNYIIHSSQFTCSSDNRDGLRLIGNGQNNDDEAEQNRRMIDLAQQIIIDFISGQKECIDDVRYLVPVKFNTHTINEELAKYYLAEQESWVRKFSEIPLAINAMGAVVKANNFVVMDRPLLKIVDEATDDRIVPMLYNLMQKAFGNEKLPQEQELTFWSQTIRDWYEEEQGGRDTTFCSLEQLEEFVDGKSIDEVGRENLLLFDNLLDMLDKDKSFEKYALIPNRKGQLRIKSGKILVLPINISDDFLSILSVIVPQDVDKFVDEDFANIATIQSYTIEDAHKDIGIVVDKYNRERTRVHGELSNATDKQSFELQNREYIDNSILSQTERDAYMLYYAMAVKNDDGGSYFASTLSALREFNNFHQTPDVIFNYEQAKISSVSLALTKDAFFRFSRMGEEEQERFTPIIKQLVEAIYNKNNERKNILSLYKIYPDETGCFRYSAELYRQSSPIVERIKEMYDVVVLGNEETDIVPANSIHHQLLRSDFSSIFVSEKTKSAKDLADSMMEEFKKDGYPNVAEHKWKAFILEILEHIGEEGWKDFTDIADKKNSILVSAIEDENRQNSIYKLLKVDDAERLKMLAEVADDENITSILKLGREALLKRQNADADFEYKKSLGKYVEDLIQEQLNDSLAKDSIKIPVSDPVKNEQWGQDLMVYLNEEPIYYIEVKSRWSTNDSVEMSSRQFKCSVMEKEHYALCEVDMTKESRDNVVKHVYPHVKETLSHINVIMNIGELNSALSDNLNEKSQSIHIGGDYKVVVPQTVWDKKGCPFEGLISEIKRVINLHLAVIH